MLLTELERGDVNCFDGIRRFHLDCQSVVAIVTASPPPGVVSVAVNILASLDVHNDVLEYVDQCVDLCPKNNVYDSQDNLI